LARKIEVQIVGDASALSRAFSKAGLSSDSFGSKLGHVGKVAGLVAGAAGFGALFATLKVGIGEFKQHALVAAQTDAVIKSTGGSANVTAKQIDQLASSMMKKTGIDDETIQSGENMLLTFTNIRNEVGKGNDVFNQSTSILADMSTALGTDMSKSAIQLGKALNDPIKGISALRRVGVSFTDAQTAMIQKMVESGDTMGAQKLILAELTKEFGGSAEAAGKTLPGQLNILKETFSNVAGEIVAKMIPALKSILDWVQAHWSEIEATIKGVFDGIAWAWSNILEPTFKALIEAGKFVVGWVRDHWPEISAKVTEVFNQVKADVLVFVGFFQDLWAKFGTNILTAMRETWNQIRDKFHNTFDEIRAIFKIVSGLLHGDFGQFWEGVKELFSVQVEKVKDLFQGLWDGFKNIGNAAIKLALLPFDALWSGIKLGVGKLSTLAEDAWGYITAIGTKIADKAKAIEGWGMDIVHGITGAFANLGSGLASGVHAAWDDVRDAFSWLKDKIVGWLKKAFDWFSPSGLFEELGSDMMAGLAKGIMEKATDPLGAVKMLFRLMGKEFPGMDWLKNIAGKGVGLVKHAVGAAVAGVDVPGPNPVDGMWQREKNVLVAANIIAGQNWPYAVGGGHNDSFTASLGAGSWSGGAARVGFDCSGAVGAIMNAGDFQSSPMVSGDYLNWGSPGYGKYISTLAIPGEGGAGHVFAVISVPGGGGWGTGANATGGPGWYEHDRSGYTVRHPYGSQGMGGRSAAAVGGGGAQGIQGPDAFRGNYLASPGIRDLLSRGILDIGDLPRFAKGTSFAPGGMALVGEEGPELVNLPRGSQVIPNDMIGGRGWRDWFHAFTTRVWSTAGGIWGWPNKPSEYLPDHGLFVGMTTEEAAGNRTGVWPKWFVNWFTSNNEDRRNAAKMTLLHEWAHAFQNRDTIKSYRLSEGGATAFALQNAASVYSQAGIPYATPSMRGDPYAPLARWVMANKSDYWINFGQFAGKGGIFPSFAGGTRFAPGGLAWVGERGRELMYVPRGSQITPNHDLASVGGGGDISVTIPVYLDGQKVAESTLNRLVDKQRRNGSTGLR
jgi:hypothetical protein